MKKITVIFLSFSACLFSVSLLAAPAETNSSATAPGTTTTAASEAEAAGPDSPLKVTGATTIDVKKAEELFRNGTIFIDVRRDNDWGEGHIPQAHHLFLDRDFTLENLQKLVPDKATPVVIYCNGKKCLRSSKAAKLAVDWGYKNIYYFRDGFPAWKLAGNPAE